MGAARLISVPFTLPLLIGALGIVLPFCRGKSRRQLTEERALAYERSRRMPPPEQTPDAAQLEMLAALDGPHALAAGTLDDGTTVRVHRGIKLKHGLTVGASGSGKTRTAADGIDQVVIAMANGDAPEVEVELVDPKGETSDFCKASWAARMLRGPQQVADWIRANVWVAGWRRDRVTPMPPFDNAGGRISDAYLADLRTQATAEASSYPFTDATLHSYRMYSQLATALRHPPNYAVCAALHTDPGLRARVVRDVADPFLRAYFETIEDAVPRSTIAALLRRVQYQLSFPEVRASIGIPPAAIDALGLRRTGLVRLVDVSTRFALPPGMAGERATHRVIDVLRSAQTRDTRRAAVLILEEAAALLARSPELGEPLATGARTLRSFNVGIWFIAQDCTTSLSAVLLEPLVLNSFWMAVFQSRRDAVWLAEQVVGETTGAKAGAEARRTFQRDIENLPPQTYYLWPKGHRVLRLRAMDCPDPSAEGMGMDELIEFFDREVSSASMVPIVTADRLIAEWEASILSRHEIAPPSAGAGRQQPYSMADLLRDLSAETEGDTDG